MPTLLRAAFLSLILGWPGAAIAAENAATAPDSGTGRTLEDFFTAAMEHSPRLRVAADRVDVGGARKRQANGQLLPQINASGSLSENRQEDILTEQVNTFRGEQYSLQLRQVLFNWQTFSRRGQAYATENQYEAEYYQELATLLADVAERYFNVLEARDALTSIESELEAIRTQLNQVERLYNIQMAPITDLYDAEARVAELEAEQVSLEGELSIAREMLRSASGLTVGSLFELDEDTELPTPEGDAQEWAERARASSHQIEAREHALEVADKQVSERRGAYMPQVSLIAQHQRSNLGFQNRQAQETSTGYLGIDVTVPLFAGGSNRASVSEAQSRRSMARNELRQVQLEVSDQARQISLQLQANERRIQAAERTLESMTVSAESRQRAFDMGNITSVELLEALRDRFRAERDLQALRYEHIKLSLRLRQTAGTLEAEDMVRVSGWLEPAGEE